MTFSKLISGTIPHNYVHGGYKRRDRGGIKPSRFIVHHWAGTAGGDARLANPSQEASANYLVYSDGTIKGQVPEEYGAWTSGSAAADNPSITIEVQNSGGQVNGNNDDPNSWPISAAAWKSLVALLSEVAKRRGFDAGSIRYHREFDATACPGGYIWHRRAQLAADARKGAGSGGTTPKPSGGGKTVSQLADEVIAGAWGNDPQRTQRLLAAGHDANAVQAEVNRRFAGGGSAPKPAAKTVAQLADEVIAGKHGNGADRQRSLGSQYAAVQAEVNRRLGGGSAPRPSVDIDALARAVIRGEYGNGAERQRRLGANYAAVQARVNQILA